MIKLEQKLTLKLKSKKYKKLQCRQHKVTRENLTIYTRSCIQRPVRAARPNFAKMLGKLEWLSCHILKKVWWDVWIHRNVTDRRTYGQTADGQAELLCWRKRESKVASKNQQSISRRQSWRVWELQFISSSGSETFGHIYRNYLKNETETTLCFKKSSPFCFSQ